MEKIVDRSELVSDREESTPPSSPDLAKFRALDEFEFVKLDQDIQSARGDNGDDGDDEMEFQLFAPTKNKTDPVPATVKIRLDSPELENGNSGFIVPSRKDSYYFAGNLSSIQAQNIHAAAMSGQDVLAQAQGIWPGSALPWKVLHIPSTKKQQALLSNSNTLYAKLTGRGLVARRTRPGKKARIARRVKSAAKDAKREEARKAAELKEEAEKEKRTRRNREKKVKKKNREKAKKAEASSIHAGENATDGRSQSPHD